jgi:hypothetical protein
MSCFLRSTVHLYKLCTVVQCICSWIYIYIMCYIHVFVIFIWVKKGHGPFRFPEMKFGIFVQYVTVFWSGQSSPSFQVIFEKNYIHDLLVIFSAFGLAIVVGNDDDGLPLYDNNFCNLYLLWSNLSVGNPLFIFGLQYIFLWPSWKTMEMS